MKCLPIALLVSICLTSPQVVRAAETQPDESPSPEVVKLLSGPQVVDVIRRAKKVQAALQPGKSFFEEDVKKYQTRFGPVDVSDKHAMQLRKLLFSKDSYLFDVGKGCAPDYGVRVRFEHEQTTVDVLFCFGCQQLQVYVDGKSRSGGLFDPSAPDFARLMKHIFPQDKAIQSLDE